MRAKGMDLGDSAGQGHWIALKNFMTWQILQPIEISWLKAILKPEWAKLALAATLTPDSNPATTSNCA
jgi:hypothetical protein